MSHAALDIVYEDAELLVVNKPPGVATTPASARAPCLQQSAEAYLRKASSSASVFLATCGRLDLPVTGLVVFAKTRAAAAHLAAQYRRRAIVKIYRALVSGSLASEAGSLHHWLREGGSHAKARVVPVECAGAREAQLDYRVVQRYAKATLVEVNLLTGRRHQIRAQLSHIGHPIWGDYKYGSRMAFPWGIALFAQTLRFVHPIGEQPIHCSLPLPRHWPSDIETLCLTDKTWLQRAE